MTDRETDKIARSVKQMGCTVTVRSILRLNNYHLFTFIQLFLSAAFCAERGQNRFVFGRYSYFSSHFCFSVDGGGNSPKREDSKTLFGISIWSMFDSI